MSARRPKFVRFNKKCQRIYRHKKDREQRRRDAGRLERFFGGDTYVFVHGTRVKDLVVRKRDGALGTLVPDGFVILGDGISLLPAFALKHWPSEIVETLGDTHQRVHIGDWVEVAKYDTIEIPPYPDSPEAALELETSELRWMLEERAALLREQGGVQSCQYGNLSRADIREQVAKVRELRMIVAVKEQKT